MMNHAQTNPAPNQPQRQRGRWFYRLVRRVSVPDMQKWPVNSSRFLLPCIAFKGYAASGGRLILAFWKWRADFEIGGTDRPPPTYYVPPERRQAGKPNVKDEPRR